MRFIKVFLLLLFISSPIFSQNVEGLIYCNTMYNAARYWVVSKDYSLAYLVGENKSYIALFSNSPSPSDSVELGGISTDFLQDLNVTSDSSFAVTTTHKVLHFAIRRGALVPTGSFKSADGMLPAYLDEELRIYVKDMGDRKNTPSYVIHVNNGNILIPSSQKTTNSNIGVFFPIQRVFVNKHGREIYIPQSQAGKIWIVEYGNPSMPHRYLEMPPLADEKKERWEFYYDRATSNIYAALYSKKSDVQIFKINTSTNRAIKSWTTKNEVLDIMNEQIYYVAYNEDDVAKKKMTCHYLDPLEDLNINTIILDEIKIK